MIAVPPFGSVALQLSADLRIVTKITHGSDAQENIYHLLHMEIVINRIPQLKQ